MLYDILIIDDDFSGETVLDDLTLPTTQGNASAWGNTIMRFYFKLNRKNLKVIWSTGEIDDLEKLENHQLSTIKYIICDLHLAGINDNSDEKIIIAKIMGILKKLNGGLNEKNIPFLINSKYIDKHSKIKDKLQTSLNEKYPSKKYAVTAFDKKNAITGKQKQALLDTSLLSHIKEQIINKHLQVERCLNEKINAKEAKLEGLGFSSKYKIVKQFFNLNGHNKQIENLNHARNYIAHNEVNSLTDLKNEKGAIKDFKIFSDLTDYIKIINDLIATIRKSKSK